MSKEEVPELVPVRMLNEYVYCPRLCYMMWVQSEFVDNEYTVDGRNKHKRVDQDGKKPPSSEELEDPFQTSSVYLSGEKCGLTTKIDIVKSENDKVEPIEYKRSKAPDVKHGAYDSDRVQICAQGLILRENGYECERGCIYFKGSKKKVEIPLDENLIEFTLELLSEMKSMAEKGVMPSPLKDSPKCPGCSLVGICLPDEINTLKKSEDKPRKLVPSRDDKMPIYISGYGHSLHKKGNRVEIRKKDGGDKEVPFRDISQVCLYGDIYVTSSLLRKFMQNNIPVCYFSYGGWFYGVSKGMPHKNVELRKKQYVNHFNQTRSLEVSKKFVIGKIKNCRTMLRRNDSDIASKILSKMSELANKVEKAEDKQELLGLEGAAAQTYFSRFSNMFKDGFDFNKRDKRPPRDPINAILSYLYGMLTKEYFVTLMSVGFDPYLGFYHSPKYGRPALALDMIEEFRPLIAESVAITLFNNDELKDKDFVETSEGVNLKPKSKKKVIRGYERRIKDEITHPIFEYKVSYRRILEIQSRLLGRWLLGEIKEYPPFCTR